MISIKNKTTHHLLDYEKVQATFSWGNVARDLDGFPNGKGLNLTHESVDRHAQTHLKNTTALRFIRKDNRSQEFTYTDLQKQTSKFANVLQKLKIQKGERVFSFAGRIPELHSTALGTLKYTAVFGPLFSVFRPKLEYQRLSKGNAPVLVTTTLLFEKKIKQILEKLPSLRYLILTDATKHASEKIRSFSKLMDEADTEFTIPETNLEDPALLHFHPESMIWGQENFGIPILDNWWQTETGGIMIANYPSILVKPGSMGKPLPGVEIAIASITDNQLTLLTQADNQGYLVLKKGFPSLFCGYIHEEERYKKCFIGDWYLSGDLAKKDSDGYFWFIGRDDDIIKTSGHLVGAFEVENILIRHPYVGKGAVIGILKPTIGEFVKAFAVLKTEIASNVETKMNIMAFTRKEMGPAVAPKEIEFMENFPKTRSGKILRRLLKARELGLPEGDISTLKPS